MELNKKNMKKIIGIITFAIVLYFLLQNVGTVKQVIGNILGILSPFLIGAGVAFILNIPMKFLEGKLFKPKKMKNGKVKQSRLKRPVSILLSIILVLLIISFVIKLIIPQIISVIVMFASEVPSLLYDLKDWAIEMTEQYPDISNQIKGIEINWDKLTNDAINFITNIASGLVTSSIGFIVSLIGGIFDTVISLVFAIYILGSKEKLGKQFEKIVKAYLPEDKAKYLLEIGSLSKNTFCNFITGQCIEAMILGILCFIGMTLLKIPFAATVSVVVGVTVLIPMIGAFIGMVVGAVLIVSISPIKALVFVIFILILQQIENNAIYPKVVGDSVGLPGMWVLVAVVVGGSLGGALGLLLGLPTVSVLYSIFRNDVNQRLEKKKNLTDRKKSDVL